MEKLSSNRLNDDTIKLLKRVAYSLFQSIVILFLGLSLIFLVSSWIIDDIQFGSFIGNFFIGNWGISDYGWSRGYEVLEWMSWMFPKTLELIIGPIIIGSLLGVILGRISASNLNKWQDKTVKLFSALGISIPVFFLGVSLQVIFGFHLKNLTNGAIYLPMSGLSSMSISNPPFLTGFRTLDCLFAGEWDLLWDTIWHLILPGIVFTIFVISIVIIYEKS